METPYRNNQLLGDLVQSLKPETLLCIACDISGPEEFIRTKPIRIWKNNLPDIHKKPTMFLIYK
jgi:16S rRNA (cytidine1402-2'-O)-methyltransferase